MDNYCGHSYIKCQHSKCWHFSDYTIKQSNGVMTIDNNKKNVIKQIFWDMNSLTSEVKDEMVTEQGTNTGEYVNWRQAGASRKDRKSTRLNSSH